MTDQGLRPARKLPGVIIGIGSLIIAFHLFALLILVLAAQSGPWSVSYLPMRSTAGPPQFANMVSEYTTRLYLHPLSLANDYHFVSNHTDLPTVQMEVVLLDGDKKLQFPDPHANPWVRYRQRLLVQGLSGDMPYQGSQLEGVVGPDQKVRKIAFLCPPFDAMMHKLAVLKDKDCRSRQGMLAELAEYLTKDELTRYQDEILKILEAPNPDGPTYRLTDKTLDMLGSKNADSKYTELYQESEHRMPKMPPFAPPLFTPAPTSLILARSMARYLDRQHGSKVELVRQHRDPLSPAMMFPSMRTPEKLLIDDPPYPLETRSCNLSDGHPRKWFPR